MALNRMPARHPEMPSGTEVAAFRTHQEASAAVERLADNQFPINTVTIVGSDLHMAEKVLTKLTPAKVALTGATQGLTWGLFMAIFTILFYPQAVALVPIIAIVVGVLLGMILSTASWSLNKNRGTFAAQSSLVATRYAVLVTEMPDRAFNILAGMPGNMSSQPRRPTRREPARVHAPARTDFSAPAETRDTAAGGPVRGEGEGGGATPDGARWDNVSGGGSQAAGTGGAGSAAGTGGAESTTGAGVAAGGASVGGTGGAGGAEQSPGTAADAGLKKPTEYGSRPDEVPRFGVRLSDMERERQGGDSAS